MAGTDIESSPGDKIYNKLFWEIPFEFHSCQLKDLTDVSGCCLCGLFVLSFILFQEAVAAAAANALLCPMKSAVRRVSALTISPKEAESTS